LTPITGATGVPLILLRKGSTTTRAFPAGSSFHDQTRSLTLLANHALRSSAFVTGCRFDTTSMATAAEK
jgi:hypothetical protein